MDTLNGWDWSHFQGAITAQMIAEGDVAFVVHKVSDGTGTTLVDDPFYKANAEVIKGANCVLMNYHELGMSLPVDQQAQLFLSLVDPLPGYDWVALESFVEQQVQPQVAFEKFQQFSEALVAAGRPAPGLYGDYNRYEWMQQPTVSHLWLADAGVPAPPVPCTLWQRGTQNVPGTTLIVDQDVFYGDLVALHQLTNQLGGNMPVNVNAPPVAILPTPTGKGYSIVCSDGGVFDFGDAVFHGSEGGQHLNLPIVDGFPTKSGNGYYLVGADGGVFTFGDAVFYGSEGGKPLDKPVVAGALSPSGAGYYLIAADGGVFTFGDAEYIDRVVVT